METESLCLECPGPPKPPSRAFLLERIPWLCRNQEKHPLGDIVRQLWLLTRDQPTIALRVEDVRRSFQPETLRLISELATRDVAELAKPEGQGWLEWKAGPEFVPEAFVYALAGAPLPKPEAADAGRPAELTLDVSGFTAELDLHEYLAEALNFPVYYGQNWDAFFDCIRYADDPSVRMPRLLRVRGMASLSRTLPDAAKKFAACLADYATENPGQCVVFEPEGDATAPRPDP